MSPDKRFSRPVAAATVLLCFWMLGSLGFVVLLRLTGPWLFPPTEDFALVVRMLGVFHGLRAAAMLPALMISAVVVAHSRFAHPGLVLAGMLGGAGLFSLLVRWILKRPLWESVAPSGVAVSFVFELISALVFPIMGVLFLAMYRRLLNFGRGKQFII